NARRALTREEKLALAPRRIAREPAYLDTASVWHRDDPSRDAFERPLLRARYRRRPFGERDLLAEADAPAPARAPIQRPAPTSWFVGVVRVARLAGTSVAIVSDTIRIRVTRLFRGRRRRRTRGRGRSAR